MNTNTSGGEVHCLSRLRFSPFCLQTCDSCLQAFLLLTSRFASALPVGHQPRSCDRRLSGAWVLAQDFAFTWHARPSYPTESSSHLSSAGSPFITDRRFAFSCSPRSGYAAAVTFRYRPAVSGLTGTSTPLRCAPSQSHIGVGMACSRHPSLQTGQADLPHPAFQSVSSREGLKPLSLGGL